jgi:hypothetical protein
MIQLGGRVWTVIDVPSMDSGPSPVPYVCVSYAHGKQRSPHPFDADQEMSSAAPAAIEAALATEGVDALWVDAFSVPFDEEARETCLRQMGSIYGNASKVVVVLGKDWGKALFQARQGKIDGALLQELESDVWVSRAWTYQELANAGEIEFAAEGSPGVHLKAHVLLNALGDTIAELKKSGEVDSFTIRNVYPNLDRFEDLVGGWMGAPFLEGNVYQIMAGMHGRHTDPRHPDDVFNAILGSISPDWQGLAEDLGLSAAERFMRVCESKPDFSFLFAATERSAEPGRRWRPVLTDRPEVIFPWHCQGPPLIGKLREDGLDLEQMWRPGRGPLSSDLADTVRRSFSWAKTVREPSDLPRVVLEALRKGDFVGSGDYLELRDGLFFSRAPLPKGSDWMVAVAIGLKLLFGGPALLLGSADASGRHEVKDIGVYFGITPATGEVLRLA